MILQRVAGLAPMLAAAAHGSDADAPNQPDIQSLLLERERARAEMVSLAMQLDKQVKQRADTDAHDEVDESTMRAKWADIANSTVQEWAEPDRPAVNTNVVILEQQADVRTRERVLLTHQRIAREYVLLSGTDWSAGDDLLQVVCAPQPAGQVS